MNKDLTRGPVMRSMLLLAVPMILGNLLQQCYNIADTLIVGQFLGKDALAAVGSSFTLMTFLTSILLGLCMGSGALFSIRFGQRDEKGLREAVWASFVLIAAAALVLNVLAFACLDALKTFLRVPEEVWPLMRAYLAVIFFGIALYAWFRCPQLRGIGGNFRIRRGCLREIAGYSVLTCVQQSVMNLGILMVQGLVNSFGSTVMAAFAAAVKIDAFAYMPVQDFGNAFSTFIAQNYGAGKEACIRTGLKGAAAVSGLFCVGVSALVWVFAAPLMTLFVEKSETGIILEGVRYLRIEGAFYCGIGCLFLLYGLYRALGRPGMSVVPTVISLGSRVALAYGLSAVPFIGVTGIWWSVPIGWALADITGILYYILRRKQLLSSWEPEAAANENKNA